jgi:hypothetical protein
MLASAYNTQNNNLHQNVGALCKMSAPYAKCRHPMQNVGALKCQRLLKNVGAHEIFQEATAPIQIYAPT